MDEGEVMTVTEAPATYGCSKHGSCVFIEGHEGSCSAYCNLPEYHSGRCIPTSMSVTRSITPGSTSANITAYDVDAIPEAFKPLQPSLQAQQILNKYLPEWQDLFVRKNAKYKRVVGTNLGPRGVFPDINRKTAILRLAVWDSEPLPQGSEDVREVINDLIGHLFLLRWELDNEQAD
jgi:hypothetical protein